MLHLWERLPHATLGIKCTAVFQWHGADGQEPIITMHQNWDCYISCSYNVERLSQGVRQKVEMSIQQVQSSFFSLSRNLINKFVFLNLRENLQKMY